MSEAYDSKIGSQSSSVANDGRKTASHGELYGLTCKVALVIGLAEIRRYCGTDDSLLSLNVTAGHM